MTWKKTQNILYTSHSISEKKHPQPCGDNFDLPIMNFSEMFMVILFIVSLSLSLFFFFFVKKNIYTKYIIPVENLKSKTMRQWSIVFSFCFIIFIFLKFYPSAVDIQCCDNLYCATKWFIHTCTHIHSLLDSFPT